MASTEQRKIEIIANGTSVNASFRDMTAAVKLLNNQMQKLPQNSDEFTKKKNEYQAMKTRVESVKKEMYGTNSALGGMLNTLKPIGTAFLAAFSFQAVVSGFKAIINVNKDYEKSLSSLSSITGATGEDLEFYSEQAKEIGRTTTLSASQAVDAFKLMGSAKPELLKNKEALAEVTKEAVALAEAAEIDLPSAAQSLAGALNQFNLPASEASRVINALAAGSKEGAAAIPQITEAIDKFGPAANAFNVSVEESVGLVETLAEKNIKGAEAGTALRNVLSRMQSVQALPKEALEQLDAFGVNLDVVSDKTIPLNKRLEEFSKISGDATALTKVFGRENQIAGQIILENVDSFQRYTDAVTGTSTAYEQQAINNDNLDGSFKQMNSAIEGLILSFNGDGGLTSAVRWVIDTFTSFINTMTIANQSIDSIKAKARSASLATAIAEDKNEIEFLAQRYMEVGLAADEYSAKQRAVNSLTQQYLKLLESESDQKQIEDIQKQVAALEEYGIALDIENKKEIESLATLEEVSTKKVDLTKKQLDDRKKLREDYLKAEIDLERSIQDLKIAVMEEGEEKRLAQVQLTFDREMEELEAKKQMILDNTMVTEMERDAWLIQWEEEKKLREELKAEEEEEIRLEQREERIEKELEELTEEDEIKAELLGEQVGTALDKEAAVAQLRLDRKKAFLQEELRMLQEQGLNETTLAKSISDQIADIEKQKADLAVSEEKRKIDFQKTLRNEGYENAKNHLANAITLLEEEGEARKAAGIALKAVLISETLINTYTSATKAYNALAGIPIYGPALGAVAAGLAVASGLANVAKISSTQYAHGGTTGDVIDMYYDGNSWRQPDHKSAKWVNSFARGGHINSASFGLIGEKGAEWVSPNWMLKSPKYANIFGYLEAERVKGRAFETGGTTAKTTIPDLAPSINNQLQKQSMRQFDEMNMKLEILINVVREWPTILKVYSDPAEMSDAIKTLNEIESDSRITRE